MIVNFVYPSSATRTGGVTVLYEFANGLARRGHEVHFIHGPATPYRVAGLDELPFRFVPEVRHHLVDDLDAPGLVEADIVFNPECPERLGLPVAIIQGYRMMLPEVEERTFRRPVPKVCVAGWLVDVGVSLGAPAEQFWHVPVGIDHGVFRRSAPIDAEARALHVAMLHHPHAEKGWETGHAALCEVAERVPGFRAVVFGVVKPRRPLPRGVEFRHGLSHRTLVDEVYNATRVFVQSSRHEGFGLTPVEAMACGAAVVTTDNGGSRDYAHHGDTALVVPVDDAPALAAATGSLLADEPRRRALAEAGERFVRRFDWAVSAELLEGHLERYLADPAAFQKPPAEPDHEEDRSR